MPDTNGPPQFGPVDAVGPAGLPPPLDPPDPAGTWISAPPTGQRWLIPGYQYPTLTYPYALWTLLGQTATRIGVPPASTPAILIATTGTLTGTPDANYTTAIANAQANGWTVYGYVNCASDTNSTGVVKKQIDYWFSEYGIINIFFDNVDNTTPNINYATALTSYVHTTHGAGKSVMNMGAAPAAG